MRWGAVCPPCSNRNPTPVAGRILVIRGGAIGDFVLTLPALRLLREGLPEARIELLGYRHIVELAVGRYYAEASRSIEYGPLSAFFARKAELPPELVDYFASFDQIISYLFDPDGIFQENLARCGQKDVVVGASKFTDQEHVIYQLARPLEQFALFLDDPAARIYPSEADLEEASRILPWPEEKPAILIHPGSGSPRKNWPAGFWREAVARWLAADDRRCVAVLSGESDGEALGGFGRDWSERVWFVPRLALPTVAGLCRLIPRFVGHDSGMSHLAAAVGARCLLLFGPTAPEQWAPLNPGVSVCRAPDGCLENLRPERVLQQMEEVFSL